MLTCLELALCSSVAALIPPVTHLTLAGRILAQESFGKTPVWYLPSFGGVRFPIVWILQGAAFAGYGALPRYRLLQRRLDPFLPLRSGVLRRTTRASRQYCLSHVVETAGAPVRILAAQPEVPSNVPP